MSLYHPMREGAKTNAAVALDAVMMRPILNAAARAAPAKAKRNSTAAALAMNNGSKPRDLLQSPYRQQQSAKKTAASASPS